MKMLVAAALFAAALLIGMGSPKGAAAGGSGISMLGVVAPPGSPAARNSPQIAPADVTYHGGWVMRTNTTYAIYWFPPGSTCGTSDPTCDTYISGVDRYFKDVAAASGSHNNVYSVDTEYSDTTGPIAYQSTFGGAFIDETPFPPYNPSTSCADGGYPVCLTDQQIQTEIQKVITELGWPDSESSLFSLMTPDSVTECETNTDNQCVGHPFCAYHGAFTGSESQPVVYTLEPFAATDGCAGNPVNPSPNGDDADPTVNLISHEMNEAITDPWGTGWYAGDTPGLGEIADLCAWNFGNPLGTAANGQAYNEVINGHPYWLQQEWSNDTSQCLQRSIPSSTAPPILSGLAGVGRTLSTTAGVWNPTASTFAYQWLRCATDGTGCAPIPGAIEANYVLAAVDADHTLEARVSATDAAGTTAALSNRSQVVVALPASTKAPHISGRARVGKELSGSHGFWTNSPTAYRYQWLRCNKHSRSCTPIHHATHSIYRLKSRDAGHRLRLRIIALNPAGSQTATSLPTARVAAPHKR